jgi:thiamine-monophosphate kinase
MTAKRVTEAGVIAGIRRSMRGAVPGVIVGIGDDCAVLRPEPGTVLLATTDLLLEGTHFRRRYAEPADIGWKSLAVNLSDIAAMGGRPRWALVALACPADTRAEEVEAFYEGMLALARDSETAVVGGDTTESAAGWVVNVTLLGDAVQPVLRSTAREGDLIAVTGPLGRAAAGLALLGRASAPAGVPADALADVTTAHLRPRPRTREGQWLGAAGGVSAMIDLSDGLVTDLGHIAAESAVGAVVRLDRIPISAGTRQLADALGQDPVPWIAGGGEDYELLLTCDPAALMRLSDGLERAAGTRLHAVGEIVNAAAGVSFIDHGGRVVTVAAGFEHFATRH